MLTTYNALHPQTDLNIPALSFLIIGGGGLACVLGGYLSQIFGTKRTAFAALLLSCACCIASPFAFAIGSESLFVGFLLFWGMVVVADSPLFSTLVAQNAPQEMKGTALTIVNCIGFSITIISILLINELQDLTASNYIYALLAIGPIIGLIALSWKSKVEL
jgi:MFS family permease